jgi:hypothetical protein
MSLLSIVSDKNKHKNVEGTFYISLGIHALWNVSNGGNVIFPPPPKLYRLVFLLKCEADNSSELYLCFYQDK